MTRYFRDITGSRAVSLEAASCALSFLFLHKFLPFLFPSSCRESEREKEVNRLKMKRCELCKAAARMYCDSDQAVLCWDCDAMVHSANFLVARHSRDVLCYVCQSPTPWNASGARLSPAVSLCERCADDCEGTTVTGGREGESERGENDDIDTKDDYDEEGEEEDDDEGDQVSADDEDRDNQVVPWSATPPPPAESSSSSEESSSRFCNSDRADSSKQLRENDADLGSDV